MFTFVIGMIIYFHLIIECPTDCKTCSNEETGSDATCTDCVADKGLYVAAGGGTCTGKTLNIFMTLNQDN